MNELTLSPSSFSFLYEECNRCFYDSAWRLGKRPILPMPKIFTSIDNAMKRHFAEGWHQLGDDLPRFRIIAQSRCVQSKSVAISGTNLSVRIRGYYDSLVEFESGEKAIIDWKTSEVRPDLVAKYSRSLHAYAYCLAYPLDGEPEPVDSLGLGVFEPNTFRGQPLSAELSGRMRWVRINKDMRCFESFIQDAGVLLGSNRPMLNPSCAYCSYRDAA